MDDSILSIARHIEDLDLGSYTQQAFCHLASIHLRHHHIGHQQMDRARMLVPDHQRFDTVPRFQHGISAPLKGIAREGPDARFVFHDQDGLRAAWLAGRNLVSAPLCDGVVHPR